MRRAFLKAVVALAIAPFAVIKRHWFPVPSIDIPGDGTINGLTEKMILDMVEVWREQPETTFVVHPDMIEPIREGRTAIPPSALS